MKAKTIKSIQVNCKPAPRDLPCACDMHEGKVKKMRHCVWRYVPSARGNPRALQQAASVRSGSQRRGLAGWLAGLLAPTKLQAAPGVRLDRRALPCRRASTRMCRRRAKSPPCARATDRLMARRQQQYQRRARLLLVVHATCCGSAQQPEPAVAKPIDRARARSLARSTALFVSHWLALSGL